MEDICVQKPLAPTIYGPKSTTLKKNIATPAALNMRMVSSSDISLRAEMDIVLDMYRQAAIATIITPAKVRLRRGIES